MPLLTGKQFVKLLSSKAKALGLSASDLGVWFERPRQTVGYWLRGEAFPRNGPALDEFARRLSLLDAAPFPVPHGVFQPQRAEYIRQAFLNADNTRISKAGAAGARAEKRNNHPRP